MERKITIVMSSKIEALFNGDAELYKTFREQFEQNPKVKALRKRVQILYKAYKCVQAMDVEGAIREIEYKAAQELMATAKPRVERVRLTDVGFTDKERGEIADLRISLDMLSDCIESITMRINEILREHDNGLEFEDYKSTLELLREAKRHLSWVNDNTDYRKFETWGTECDKLLRSVQNKVEAIKRGTRKEMFASETNS